MACITFCLIHSAARRCYPVIGDYGVCIKSEELQHFSLHERPSIDATLRVVEYLNAHTVVEKTVFNLLHEQPTFDLACELAREDMNMREICEAEHDAAETRVDKHYELIQFQQAEARRLRREIQANESSLQETLTRIARDKAMIVAGERRLEGYAQEQAAADDAERVAKRRLDTATSSRNAAIATLVRAQREEPLAEAACQRAEADRAAAALLLTMATEERDEAGRSLERRQSDQLRAKEQFDAAVQASVSGPTLSPAALMAMVMSGFQQERLKTALRDRELSSDAARTFSRQKQQALESAQRDVHRLDGVLEQSRVKLQQKQAAVPAAEAALTQKTEDLVRAKDRFNEAVRNTQSVRERLAQPITEADQRLDEARQALAADEQEKARLEHLLRSLKQQLQKAETPPPPVYQPLPEDPRRAASVIFYLHAPPLLRALARASFLTQQVLLLSVSPDRRCQLLKTGRVENFTTSWKTYYDAKQLHSAQYFRPAAPQRVGTNGEVELWSRHAQVDVTQAQGRRTHIDEFREKRHGVWWPDSLSLCMVWKTDGVRTGVGGLFNPFITVPHGWTVEFYTELLPKSASSLQWAMPLLETVPFERANRGSAEQEDRPDFLMRHEFVAFTSLRAYPYTQMRKLCLSLRDRLLPLTHDAVHTLIEQTLYQLGPMNGPTCASPLWKTDVWHNGYAELASILDSLASEYAEKPRAANAIIIVGTMAAFVAQWQASSSSSCLKLARAAQRWADEISPQLLEASESEADLLCEQQCLYQMYAILSCATLQVLPISEPAGVIRIMMRAMVTIRNHLVLSDKPPSAAITSLLSRVESAMVSRIFDVMDAIEEDKSICDEAVRLILQHTPPDMDWTQVPSQNNDTRRTCCYVAEAAGTPRQIYSLNALTGAVLFNGEPPGRLPTSITSHDKYKRHFGSFSFLASPLPDGGYKTTQAVSGCFYEFHLASFGALRVIEMPIRGGYWRLELLEAEDLATSTPIRLRQLYSHWLEPQLQLLLFRGISFKAQEVEFVISAESVCFHVPQSHAPPDLAHLADAALLPDQLVPQPRCFPLLQVLCLPNPPLICLCFVAIA